jgi:putative transposase
MKRSRFSEEQIIGVLKEAEATTVKGTCAKYNISDATYYNWKRKYGRIDVDEARRLRAPEDENGRDWWPSCRSRIRSSKRSIQKNGKSVKPSTGRERHSRTSALRAQTIPPNQWEFLIVDNASDERLSEFWDLSWHPRARHIRENNLGLTLHDCVA